MNASTVKNPANKAKGKRAYRGKKKKVYVEKKAVQEAPVKVKVQNSVHPGFKNNTDLPELAAGTNVLTLPTTLNTDVLTYAMATYASFFYNRNIVGANINSMIPAQIAGGLAYLAQGIITVTQGETVEFGTIPRIFDVLIQLLSPKKVKLPGGEIHYSPNWTPSNYDLPWNFTTGVGTIYSFSTPTPNSDFTPLQAGNVPIGDGDYAALMRAHDTSFLTWGSATVLPNYRKGLFTNDPSCYARNYTYFGTSGPGQVSGYYNEAELEVPTLYPQFSAFVAYDQSDQVISRVFRPRIGGISTAIGMSLISKSSYSTIRNPIPIQYKFIDFYQVYSTVCSWLVSILSEVPSNLQGVGDLTKSTTFKFSARDFQFVLRQAILSVFPEQIHGQFVAPVEGLPTVGDSKFQPFIVDSITSPRSEFSKMLLPAFLVENLNMLKSKYVPVTSTSGSKKFGTEPKKLAHVWTPVWGVYSGDSPAEYQFADPYTQNTFLPLFQATDEIPGVPRLSDCLAALTPNKVNINNQVSDIIAYWNEYANTYLKSKSTPLSPLSADAKITVNLLSYTRVLQWKPPLDEMTSRISKFNNPNQDYLINKPYKKEVIRTKSGSPPIKVVQPASYLDLYTRTITSMNSMGTDVVGAAGFFILPTIRLNESNGDYLTLNAYQVVTGELAQASNISGNNWLETVNEYNRLLPNGALMTSGMLAADSTNDTLTQAVKVMSDHGGGLDFLNTLLGGLASMIPVVGPMVSGLITGQ